MKKLDKLIGFLDKLNLEDEIEKEEIILSVWRYQASEGTFNTTFHQAKAALPHKTFCGKYNKSVKRLE